MEHIKALKEKIHNQSAQVAVIGLGYVGLPVACMLADCGFSVIGIDIKEDRVNLINKGISPIEGKEPGLSTLLSDVIHKGKFLATTEYKSLRKADIILIDVETPIDENHIPQYQALKSACRSQIGRAHV